MRLFIAIDLSPDAKTAVASVANGLRFFGDGSFCPEDSYHITLAFVGETESARPIIAAINKTLAPLFTLTLDKAGCFENTHYVSVKDCPALFELQKALCKQLEAEGVGFDKKRFVPHVTVVRRFKAACEPLVFVPEVSWRVDSICLMATVGAGKYKILHKKNLSKKILAIHDKR